MKRSTNAALFALTALMVAVAGLVLAQTAPHWEGAVVSVDCTSQCHVPHQAPGSALSSSASNVNLCQSCHNPVGLAGDLPIATTDKAVPRVSGTSHAFDVLADNTAAGAQAPTDFEMSRRLPGNKVICSTCHNQHRADSTNGGTPRVGNSRQVTALGSTGAITAAGVFSGPEGVWYLIEIVQGGSENNSRFCYSKDNGISWFPTGCNPPATTTPNLTANGANPVALDSGVSVTFVAGTYAAGERWEFSAAYPFLRVPLGTGGSNLCAKCHGGWFMDHDAVETWTGSPRSHPVGVALNANGKGYDRAAPLDGNGNVQGGAGADGNPTNDLRLFGAGNVVQCLTCHGVHFVDSNTETVDQP